VLGKPFISELRALGEQFDEYIRRFQRYKPELKFDAATPEARLRRLLCCVSAETPPRSVARSLCATS
jgi:hypothetical protein